MSAERFLQSMAIDYGRWRDGEGYDLEALARASPEDRAVIEAAVLAHQPRSWHDVEALALLDTPRSREAILAAREDLDPMTRAAVLRHAPQLLTDEERTAMIVDGLETAEFYAGLSQFLDHVEEWHPAPVIEALLRGVRRGQGEVAVHFAAMLMYLHGRAAEPFDWELRPFFLRFNTAEPGEREAAFRELCQRIGTDARP
jgi:hypothetical protein